MNKFKFLKHFFMVVICLIWIIIEDDFRKLFFCDNKEVLFVIDTKPISVYKFIVVVLIILADIYSMRDKKCKNPIKSRNILIMFVISFILPLMFIQARTEVSGDSVTVYDFTGNIKSRHNIQDADYVICKLDYCGSVDIPYNGVRFCYEICFPDDNALIYSSSSEKFWNDIQMLNSKVEEIGVEKKSIGYDYINTVENFNTIDQLCNYPFGVYSHIEDIASIMNGA